MGHSRDPTYVPTPQVQRRLGRTPGAIAHQREDITAETSTEIRFSIAGRTSDRIGCPNCAAEIDLGWGMHV